MDELAFLQKGGRLCLCFCRIYYDYICTQRQSASWRACGFRARIEKPSLGFPRVCACTHTYKARVQKKQNLSAQIFLSTLFFGVELSVNQSACMVPHSLSQLVTGIFFSSFIAGNLYYVYFYYSI